MPLHLLKLAVGVSDLDDLGRIQKQRRQERGRYGFFTRNMPKRIEELLDGGSIYWVIKGHIRVRQRLKRFHAMADEEGRSYVIVEFERKPIEVSPRPFRPFQGWRYLAHKDAPPDRINRMLGDDPPPEMAAELRRLGLL